MFTVEIPLTGVAHVVFNTQRDLALTMCRVQEFYESPYPEIKGQFFTFEQFIEAYSDEHGVLTYFSNWNGFNVPRWAINQFWDVFAKRGGGLNVREQMLMDVVHTTNCRYLIATCEATDEATVDHELAHARWATDSQYREAALQALELLNPYDREDIETILLEADYPDDPEIMADEVHAYVGTLPEKEFKLFFADIEFSRIEPARNALRNLL